MIDFLQHLRTRNETLFYFGGLCFAAALLFLIFTKTSNLQVQGVNAWFKPLKFALSLGLYSWTMAWYCYYLPNFHIQRFNWTVVVLWTFELVYIGWQAGKGQASHYNVSSPVYALMYSLMATAATLVTLYTAYIGFLFFVNPFPTLPAYYVWAIRFGLLLFVLFSFQGFAMGARLNHSVGAVNDNSNWWLLGWSKSVGDLRVAHFIGLHALQILPLLSYYLLKNTKATVALALVYGLLAVATLVQALKGKPLVKSPTSQPQNSGRS